MTSPETSKKSAVKMALALAVVLAALFGSGSLSAVDSKLKGRRLIETHMFTEEGPHYAAECFTPNCSAVQSLIAYEPIECPTQNTCTYEIQVCSQLTINERSVGDVLKFSVSVDQTRLDPGPTDSGRNYHLGGPTTLPVGRISSQCMTFVDSGRGPGTHLFFVSAGARDFTGDGVSVTAGMSQVIVRVYKP